MVDQSQIELIHQNLKRLFALKVGRSTFRELQNIIFLAVKQDQKKANFLFESLLKGAISDGEKLDDVTKEKFKRVLEEFSIPARLSKEVFERGEFIHLITSDAVNQQEAPLLINRLSRIDAEEIQFITDVPSTLHILTHFLSRVGDLANKTENKKRFESYKNEIKQIKALANQLPE